MTEINVTNSEWDMVEILKTIVALVITAGRNYSLPVIFASEQMSSHQKRKTFGINHILDQTLLRN